LTVLALIVSAETDLRATAAAAAERGGVRVLTSTPGELAAMVRRARPDLLVLDVSGETAAIRRSLSRGRAAAEGQLPAVVVLPDSSVWLRAPLPRDMGPGAGSPGENWRANVSISASSGESRRVAAPAA
jgi:hypothetical protein